MSQHDQSTLAVVSIVLIFCVGIGGLIAFVADWMNAAAWNIKNIMLIWTGCIVGALIWQGTSFVQLRDVGVAPLR